MRYRNPTSQGQVTISWTTSPGDPVFTLELTNPSFNSDLALRNTIDPSIGSFNTTLGVLPVRSDYTLIAVNIGNISDVYAQTGQFAIGAATSTSQAPSSTSSQPGLSATGSSSATGSAIGVSQVSTPAFGTTITGASSPSGTAPSGTASASASSPSSSNLNGARSAFGSEGVLAVSLLAVAAAVYAL